MKSKFGHKFQSFLIKEFLVNFKRIFKKDIKQISIINIPEKSYLTSTLIVFKLDGHQVPRMPKLVISDNSVLVLNEPKCSIDVL